MSVSEAVDTRMSARAFTDQPVDAALVQFLSRRSSMAV